MNRRQLIIKYILLDFLAALLAWGVFFIYRKCYVDGGFNPYYLRYVWSDSKLYYGLVLIPTFWIILHALIGLYRSVYRKSRLREFLQVLTTSIAGVLIIFFAINWLISSSWNPALDNSAPSTTRLSDRDFSKPSQSKREKPKVFLFMTAILLFHIVQFSCNISLYSTDCPRQHL